MASSGNLPPNSNTNTTTEYFNNFFKNGLSVSQNVDNAVLGYFESITGSTDTARVMASTVLYTALSNGIDPMTIVDELRKLSLKNIPTTTVNTTGTTSTHTAFAVGQTYSDTITVTATNGAKQELTAVLEGAVNGGIVVGVTMTGNLTQTGNTATGTISIIGANPGSNVYIAQTDTVGEYGNLNFTTTGNWAYTVTNSTLAYDELYDDVFTLVKLDGVATQQLTFTIRGTSTVPSIAKVSTLILDQVTPKQIAGQLINLSNVVVQTADGNNKFGKFTVTSTGSWTYKLDQFPMKDPMAIAGPNNRINNLSELDAYLTMFLNINRVGTSLLGLSNSPQTNKYIQRAILP